MADKRYTGFSEIGDTHGDGPSIAFVVEQLMHGMATATLVLVKASSATTVDVQPMVNQIDGAGNAIPHGTIHGLPFFSLRAGNSAFIAKPKVGDIGIAVFCHNDISSAKANAKPANPGSWRRNDWADGLYLGGFLGATPTQFISVDDAAGITITSTVGVTINGPVTINGNVTQTGNLTSSGTVTGTTDVIGAGKHLTAYTFP